MDVLQSSSMLLLSHPSIQHSRIISHQCHPAQEIRRRRRRCRISSVNLAFDQFAMKLKEHANPNIAFLDFIWIGTSFSH